MRLWVTLAGLLALPLAARDRYAEVNGVRLHYVERGKGPAAHPKCSASGSS